MDLLKKETDLRPNKPNRHIFTIEELNIDKYQGIYRGFILSFPWALKTNIQL